MNIRFLAFLSAIASLCIMKVSYGQYKSGIIAGGTAYLNKTFEYKRDKDPAVYREVLKDFRRTGGFYIGYSGEYFFKNGFSLLTEPQLVNSFEQYNILETDFVIDYNTGASINTGRINTELYKGAAIGAMIPISMKKSFFHPGLFFSVGANVSMDRLVVFTRYTSFQEPAQERQYNVGYSTYDDLPIKDNPNYGLYNDVPYPKRLGFGTQFGVEYQLGAVSLTSGFYANNLTENIFYSVRVGLKYTFGSKSE